MSWLPVFQAPSRGGGGSSGGTGSGGARLSEEDDDDSVMSPPTVATPRKRRGSPETLEEIDQMATVRARSRRRVPVASSAAATTAVGAGSDWADSSSSASRLHLGMALGMDPSGQRQQRFDDADRMVPSRARVRSAEMDAKLDREMQMDADDPSGMLFGDDMERGDGERDPLAPLETDTQEEANRKMLAKARLYEKNKLRLLAQSIGYKPDEHRELNPDFALRLKRKVDISKWTHIEPLEDDEAHLEPERMQLDRQGLPVDPDLRRKAIRSKTRELERAAAAERGAMDGKEEKKVPVGVAATAASARAPAVVEPVPPPDWAQSMTRIMRQGRPPAAFRRELRQGREYAQLLAQQDRAQRELKDVYDVVCADPRMARTCPGDEYYDMAARLLDKFRQKRSPDQKMFHDAFLKTCVPHIYAEDFLGARTEIMKRQKRKAFNMAALILTPRRWGKTTATSMGTAVLMYVGRGITIVIFSTGLEMSTILMNKVKGYFLELPNAQKRILRESADGFYITRIDETSTASKKVILASGRFNKLIPRAATVQGTLASCSRGRRRCGRGVVVRTDHLCPGRYASPPLPPPSLLVLSLQTEGSDRASVGAGTCNRVHEVGQ